jgi:hypothetical protein
VGETGVKRGLASTPAETGGGEVGETGVKRGLASMILRFNDKVEVNDDILYSLEIMH